MQSGLNYTIVRSGGLTDEPGTGKVNLQENISEFGTIPRENVAEVLTYVLTVPRAENKTFELIQGITQLSEILAY
ncbi:NAD(P)H-binding protein [Virgibacillus byunsanensis]|uniref:NAD(P)H-binding protein n=1 Tax=Virgibacillus byunsanensis TaxID=570945 RepID=A0ABW3LM99_9BACI